MLKQFNAYEYPLKDSKGKTYYGYYSIYAEAKPCGFEGEKLVDTFWSEVPDHLLKK